ncbi:hypothetical protein ACKFR8_07290 [Corynebacterium axilliensis]|uniref:hypothetical protein n=1 Tax=Corynebacterium sp. YSMAA5_1_F9 TaxID=3383591 RepID=UPI0038D17765
MPRDLLLTSPDGDSAVVRPGQQVVAGRAGDFPLAPDDAAMHRHFLRFWQWEEDWMVSNVGNFLAAELSSPLIRTNGPIRLLPNSTTAIPVGTSMLCFTTPSGSYELTVAYT